MALSAHSTNPSTAAASVAELRRPLRWRRPAIGAAAALVCATAVSAALMLASGGSSPARVGVSPASVPAAYEPGGSVYDEQVPALARGAAAPTVPPAYAPGGSVYGEQVPTR